MARPPAYFCVVLIVLGILGLDWFVLTSSATLTSIADRELRAALGDRIEYSKIQLSFDRGLEMRGVGLFVTKDRHKVLSADRLHVVIRHRDGQFVPETVTLERARLSFSDKLLDSIAAEPSTGTIADAIKPEQLPRIVLHGGALEAAYAGILDVHSPQVFEIDEIQLVPVVDFRYFLGGKVRNALLGEWRVSGEVDLKTGAHDISLSTDNLQLGPTVRAILSPNIHRDWDHYRPEGPVKARLRIARAADGPMELVATIQPQGVKMLYSGFALPVEDVRGELDFTTKGFTVKHLTARSGPGRIWFDGGTDGYEAEAGYTFRVEMRSMPLDEKLRGALEPAAQKVWDQFHPAGMIDAIGLVKRERGPDKPVLNPLDVTFREASFRFDRFPYELEGVSGEVHIESPLVIVKYVDGRHLNGKGADGKDDWGEVHFNGVLDKIDTDVVIDLYMRGRNLALDPKLRQALPARLRQTWDEFDPSGAIDFEWHLTKAEGGEDEHRGVVRGRGNRIVYKGTPVPVSKITGDVQIEPNKVILQNLKGALDNGRVVCNGDIVLGPGPLEIRLKFDVEAGVIDDRFKAAMPSQVARVLNALKLSGGADYRLSMEMIDDPKDPRTKFALWSNLSGAVADARVRVEELDGIVAMNGEIRNGQPEAFFSLACRQARVKGKKGTDITGRGYVRGNKVSFERLRGTVYGGTADGILTFDMETTEVTAEFKVDGLELRDFRRDTARFSDRNMSGKVKLDITATGRADDLNTFTGGGSLIVTDGQLMEIPGIVSFMAGSWGGRFKAARADYTIRNGKFRVDGKNVLAFEGDASAVYAQGWMDYDLRYRFRVSSETAPLFGIDFWLFKIPSKLFDLAKSPFTKRIDGSFNDDEVQETTDPKKLVEPDDP